MKWVWRKKGVTFLISLIRLMMSVTDLAAQSQPGGSGYVTWRYLYEATARTENTEVSTLLRKHLGKTGLAQFASQPACDALNPANPCQDQTIDEGGTGLASVRLELLLLINAQPVTVSVFVVHQPTSKSVVTSGIFMHGPAAPPRQINYVPSTASFNAATGLLTFIGTVGYQLAPAREQTIGAASGGSAQLGTSRAVAVDLSGKPPKAMPIAAAGVLYTQLELNLITGIGYVDMQLEGVRGPKFSYQIKPRK